jgi:hypothetical protein
LIHVGVTPRKEFVVSCGQVDEKNGPLYRGAENGVAMLGDACMSRRGGARKATKASSHGPTLTDTQQWFDVAFVDCFMISF